MEGREASAVGRPDEDAIYRELGRFVVAFQALENQLFQLASFALDPEHVGHGRSAVADLWFRSLVDKTSASVREFLDRQGRDEPEFSKRLEALLGCCRELAHYRNKVVHSAYLFLEGGDDQLVAILRSDMKSGAGSNEVEFDPELLKEDSFNEAVSEIARVAHGIGQCRVQLIHWST